LALRHFWPNGAPDLKFAQAGLESELADPTFDIDHGLAMAIQPDNKIVVAATIVPSSDTEDMPQVLVARFTADGWLDPSFGQQGRVLTVSDHPHHYLDPLPNVEHPYDWQMPEDIAIQNDGEIVVAGTRCQSPDPFTMSPSSMQCNFLVARYGPDGNLDPSFGDLF
jgi:uncharacterized delta-60 repeat protein